MRRRVRAEERVGRPGLQVKRNAKRLKAMQIVLTSSFSGGLHWVTERLRGARPVGFCQFVCDRPAGLYNVGCYCVQLHKS